MGDEKNMINDEQLDEVAGGSGSKNLDERTVTCGKCQKSVTYNKKWPVTKCPHCGKPLQILA